jgi:acyl carrier protein
VAHEVHRHRRGLDVDEIVTAIRQAVAEEHDLEVHCVVLLKPGGIFKTSSGKIQRRACRELFLAGRLEAVACWKLPVSAGEGTTSQDGPAPRRRDRQQDRPLEAKDIRRQLVQRLSVTLGVPEKSIDVGRPFVDFGMSSLQAVALAEELERWIDEPISPTFFFNYPTITALSAHLAQLKSSSSSRKTRASIGT